MIVSNIVFLDAATLSIGDIDFAELDKLGSVKIYERTTHDEVISRCKDATIIITNKVVIDKSAIAQLANLRYICVAATGYNVVDVKAASARGIPVSNVSGYSTPSVVQHVFAMILSTLNKVESYSQQTAKGRWQESIDFTFYDHSISELAGKTLGIFGYGTIGEQVGKVALAFGMNVMAVKRSVAAGTEVNGVQFVSKKQLFAESDILSLHAPLTAETKGIINYEVLQTMKSSAILVNTGRGPLIVEADLAKALQEDQIAYACLDVLSSEPPEINSPLIGLPNCIITPHQAWASQQSRQRLLDGLVANIDAYHVGNILNRVG